MGWTIMQGASKTDIIKQIVESWNSTAKNQKHTCLKKSVKGNNLWTVWEITDLANNEKLERYIALALLTQEKGYGWGYKIIDESMGPVEIDCPLNFLKLVPQGKGPYAEGWRQRVRCYHSLCERLYGGAKGTVFLFPKLGAVNLWKQPTYKGGGFLGVADKMYRFKPQDYSYIVDEELKNNA